MLIDREILRLTPVVVGETGKSQEGVGVNKVSGRDPVELLCPRPFAPLPSKGMVIWHRLPNLAEHEA